MALVKEKRVRMSKVDFDEETTIKLARCWADFKSKFLDFLNNVEECVVELGFDSSINDKTHFTFSPDEIVFLSDVNVSDNNRIVFSVPYGRNNKLFLHQDSELINAKTKDGIVPLISILNNYLHESFAPMPDITSFTILERKYLQQDHDLAKMFNEVEAFLEKYDLNLKRKAAYSKLDDFGIF